MKWVARCDTFKTDYNLSPVFDSASECQNYIDTHLKVLEFVCYHADCLLEQNCDNHRNEFLYLHCFRKSNHYIRCYCLDQQRFADGFDF